MTHHRLPRISRALLSLSLTVGLVAGVPAVLIVGAGWPLPTNIPSIDALADGARSGIADEVIVNTLAVIAWLAWAQLTLAVVVEIIAAARGRPTTRLPVLPGFQATAARLIGGILMIASAFQPARAHAATPSLVLTPPVVTVAPTTAPPPVPSTAPDTNSSTGTRTGPQAPPASALPTVTVQRHDSYWAIAERTLGDGLRWREILDLNVGRVQPDGAVVAPNDDTLRPGWLLALPPDATVGPTTADHRSSGSVDPTVPSPPVVSETIAVEPGDNLWTIAEHRLATDLGRSPTDTEILPYWQQLIEQNRGRYVEPGNPDLILPGQILTLPPTGFEPAAVPPPSPVDDRTAPPPDRSPVETAAPDTPTSTFAPLPETGEATTDDSEPTPPTEPASEQPPDPQAPHPRSDDRPASAPAVVALGGLSSIALAVGLKRLLHRRRRRFANDHPGQIPNPTPADHQALHQAVVAQADEDRIEDLQSVLGWLAASLVARSSASRPRLVRHSDDTLEVLIEPPDPDPPPGWDSTDDGAIWTLLDPPEPEAIEGPRCAAPLLVTIGQPEDDAQLYLDLETDGLISLTGDESVATDVARSILTELALSPLAETLRVIVVGDLVGDVDVSVLEHLTVVNTWEEITDDVAAWAGQSHQALSDNGWPNSFIGRAHDPDHDALVPLAVVADQPPPSGLHDTLRTSLPSTVAVVVVGALDGACATVRCEPDTLTFEPADIACPPQELNGDELADMCRLLVTPESPEEQTLIDLLVAEHSGSSNGSEPATPGGSNPAAHPAEPPDYEVLVRLLGDICVEGGKPLKPKATAVAAYLAMHRSVTTERLEEACWFGSDGTSHRKRLRDVMTECRDALGSHHFPANRSGTYDVGPGVRTDLELFDWHVQAAADLEPAGAVAHYRAALDLVTGKPFSYPNAARASFGWVDFEHHSTSWEYRIATIAQACAELYLELDQPTEAIGVLRRLAQAVPLNSTVVEALMRAHLANGDRAGAEAVYREHAAALQQAQLGDPDDTIEQLRFDLQRR